MDYRRFGDTIVIRIDRGEELIEQIMAIAAKESLKFATVSGLGALNELTVCVFDAAEKKFYDNTFTGAHEIVSLTGTVDTMGGKPYSHLHLSAGGTDGKVVGGHLKRAVCGATAEIVLTVRPHVEIDRAFDSEIGLNLIRFERPRRMIL